MLNETYLNAAREIIKEKGDVPPLYLGWRLKITQEEAKNILEFLENEKPKVKICNHMWMPYTEIIYCMDKNKKLYEIKQVKCQFCQEKRPEGKRENS